MAASQDEDMYLFQGDMGSTPNAFSGQGFDNFLDSSAMGQDEELSTDFLSSDNLTIKREDDNIGQSKNQFPRQSTSSASSSSGSDSLRNHNRNISATTTSSMHNQKAGNWSSGISGYTMPSEDNFYDDTNMMADQDDEATNQQMNSAFDFDTAASTPSGYDAAAMAGVRMAPVSQALRRTTNGLNINQRPSNSPRMTAAPAQFYLESREASPLNAMLPTSSAPSPWTKHSPSSGLEETFHHMGMNGDSPGNATFSPNMHINYAHNPYVFEPDSSGTPSSFAKEISSPPSTIHSIDGQPTLHVYPTSLKSRVETQIPIRMTLTPLPPGVKKLRLPTYTVSKPKFLAKPEVDRSADILELHTSLVCTSAMSDPMRKQRALARARGEDLSAYTRPSPASSSASSVSRDDDDKPLNGGEVRICSGCIQRERKRASRKKQKKPEEEEMFQKDEEKRVVVFNTNEIKEWTEVTKENQGTVEQGPAPPLGAMQVELPMRIACYCRHQNEKLGFMVIFTIKDSRDRVVAQAMTNSIMITDDHKTHNVPTTVPNGIPPPQASPVHFPGSGMFPSSGMDFPQAESQNSKLFKQSFSTPDLTRLQHQHQFTGQFAAPGNAPFAIPTAMSGTTSATLTPKNLSRPASPTGYQGPTTKRRKPSGSGKLPSGLTMTRLDTAPVQPSGSATMPSTAVSSPYAPNMQSFMAGPDRSYPSVVRQPPYTNSPPTPNNIDGTFPASINRSFSLENLPRQGGLISAPASRQPSRPGSPMGGSSSRNSFGQHDATFPQLVNAQIMGQTPSRRPVPLIHKIVPAEGSVSGGTEVTLLGNGFHQGLEVMFGDTEATTTTFWGEKCLSCLTPPAIQPGMVTVVFKHEHPHYATVQSPTHARHSIYTYTDDREVELLRLALRTIGKSMGTDDPQIAAQTLLSQSQQPHAGPGMFSPTNGYGMSNGHQRQTSAGSGMHDTTRSIEMSLIDLLIHTKRRQGTSPISLDLRRPNGVSMLHLAASLNMSNFVRALVVYGADVNSLDNNRLSPMHHAAMNGNEQIINFLRSSGADHRLKSLRSFIPADLATTLQAYQATMRPWQHSRTRSAAYLQPSSRNSSARSLRSFWDNTSSHLAESELGNSSDDGSESESLVRTPTADMPLRLPYAQPDLNFAARSRPVSRRSSIDEARSSGVVSTIARSTAPDTAEQPSALANVWRQFMTLTQAQQQQLAEQFQHLQESAQWAMPRLPNLPDYQHNVVRRVSLLFPQRSTEASTESGQNQWSADRSQSTSSVAPPSYEELYPADRPTAEDIKKTSAIEAAADAAMDQHWSAQEVHNVESSPGVTTKADKAALFVPRPEAQKLGIVGGMKLFLFWVPLLVIIIAVVIKIPTFPRMLPAVLAGPLLPFQQNAVQPN